MTAPEVPLLPKQIDAAHAIYSEHTASWRRADAALAELRTAIPDFSLPEVLIKAAAVDKLYGTYCYYIDSAALRVREVLDGANLARLQGQPELVEEMAHVQIPGGEVRRYRSFASKFAHFFIDHDRFPIHDRFAADMLRAHLGMRAPAADNERATYTDRVEASWELAESVGPGADTRRLDRYLWIVGQYREWAENSRAKINWELRKVFADDPPELAEAAGTWYRGSAERVLS